MIASINAYMPSLDELESLHNEMFPDPYYTVFDDDGGVAYQRWREGENWIAGLPPQKQQRAVATGFIPSGSPLGMESAAASFGQGVVPDFDAMSDVQELQARQTGAFPPDTLKTRGRGEEKRRKQFKKGIDTDAARRGREETTVRLRKSKREDSLQKRRKDQKGGRRTLRKRPRPRKTRRKGQKTKNKKTRIRKRRGKKPTRERNARRRAKTNKRFVFRK